MENRFNRMIACLGLLVGTVPPRTEEEATPEPKVDGDGNDKSQEPQTPVEVRPEYDLREAMSPLLNNLRRLTGYLENPPAQADPHLVEPRRSETYLPRAVEYAQEAIQSAYREAADSRQIEDKYGILDLVRKDPRLKDY